MKTNKSIYCYDNSLCIFSIPYYSTNNIKNVSSCLRRTNHEQNSDRSVAKMSHFICLHATATRGVYVYVYGLCNRWDNRVVTTYINS